MSKNKNRAPTIGVLAGWQVYAGSPHSFLGPMYRALRSAASAAGCNVLAACGIGPSIEFLNIYPAWPMPSPDTDFVPVGPWNTDGLIVVTPLMSEARSQYMREWVDAGFPVVFIGGGERGPTVVVDNEGGIRQGLIHLVEHGHRRVAFIAAKEDDEEKMTDNGYRLQAYRLGVEAYGLDTDPNLITYGYNTAPGGRLAMQQVLDSGVSFTAVMASSDELAIGALQVLRETGIRIPEDIAVIGFDDRFEATAHVPPLTTIRYPIIEAGQRAVQLLLRYINGEATSIEVVQIPTLLVIRRTCGCRGGVSFRTSPTQEPASPAPKTEETTAVQQVALQAAETIQHDVRFWSLEELDALCQYLIGAFVLGLEQNNEEHFYAAVEEILLRVEAVDGDTHVWQATISGLREAIPVLLEAAGTPDAHQLADNMLHQARTAISESVRRQHNRYIVLRNQAADQIALLTTQFLMALDEAQIFISAAKSLMGADIPGFNIHHFQVAFFEADDQDPLAWTVMRSFPEFPETPLRFPSKQYPPAELALEEPFNLALFPLVIPEEGGGYVVFDATDDVGLCATIVLQLAAAFKSARLYHEATDGWRLAEEASQLKSRFLSTVSHELRTPLNLIVGLCEIMMEEEISETPLPAQYAHDLERIRDGAQHLDGLIRDVLDLARSEMGRLQLSCEPLGLFEVLQPVLAAGEQKAAAKGLRWIAQVSEDLPRVWGDRMRLRRVAQNLVNNAINFTTKGEVKFKVEVAKGTITISMSDTGMGIPVADQAHLFDEFHQVDRATARGYGGLGLELAVCRRLVELHGGTIGVRSEGQEESGSTFYFTLPVMGEPSAGKPTEIPLSLREQTVLVVGEEAGGSEILRTHLIRQGFEVTEASIDQAATWLPHLAAEPPGAVVLDVPETSNRSWEMLKLLRDNPGTQAVPLILYRVGDEQASSALLEMDYLAKPVGTAELAQALERQGLIENGDVTAKTVLLVDDEPGILEINRRIVEAQLPTCQILTARNGRQALDLIRQHLPSLVLLDLMMPEMTGFEVLEAMREGETTRNIPVVVLTGQALTEEDMARLNRGVATVLGKGLFTVEETLAHLEATLAGKRKLGSETQRTVRRAMAYIHEHYAEPISRDEVAHYVGVSNSYLSGCFQQEMGIAPMVYLNRYRVKQAKELLLTGKSVTDVAMEVGFSDASYFSRVFVKEVGIPPRAYQQGQRTQG